MALLLVLPLPCAMNMMGILHNFIIEEVQTVMSCKPDVHWQAAGENLKFTWKDMAVVWLHVYAYCANYINETRSQ